MPIPPTKASGHLTPTSVGTPDTDGLVVVQFSGSISVSGLLGGTAAMSLSISMPQATAAPLVAGKPYPFSVNVS